MAKQIESFEELGSSLAGKLANGFLCLMLMNVRAQSFLAPQF